MNDVPTNDPDVRVTIRDGSISTSVRLTAFGASFWDMWIQKCFRNIASVKYQWLLLLYIPIIWGMFHTDPTTKLPWISAALGLGFLGGGFITLALGRIISNTKLTEDTENFETLNTER